jgi:hypothetical protein
MFWDVVTLHEYIGFFVWFLVFWLLFEPEKIKNSDYKRGIFYLIICILLGIFIHSWFKMMTDVIYDTHGFLFNFGILLFFYSITWLVTTYIKNYKVIDYRVEKKRDIIILNICHAILWFLYIVFIMKAYALSDLWIVYKIQSYAIFVPIFLSILIYKEKLTIKKTIAFVLTMISLWFFL